MRKVIFAADYRGLERRDELVHNAIQQGLDHKDIGIPHGSPLDYIDISKQLAEELREDPEAIGVIVCGSGQGVSMALNRYTHIRASVCRTVEDAITTREKLNANVICLGSKQNTPQESIDMVEAFRVGKFKGAKHTACVQKLGTGATHHVADGVNLIVRALIVHEGHLLMTTITGENKDYAQDLHFLPGGHVDYNEPALIALKREIKEEMHLEVSDAEFKGVLECSWDKKGKPYHEINLVYQVALPDMDLEHPPKAYDSPFHDFSWVPVEKLEEIKLLPDTLKPLIKKALSNQKADFYSEFP